MRISGLIRGPEHLHGASGLKTGEHRAQRPEAGQLAGVHGRSVRKRTKERGGEGEGGVGWSFSSSFFFRFSVEAGYTRKGRVGVLFLRLDVKYTHVWSLNGCVSF